VCAVRVDCLYYPYHFAILTHFENVFSPHQDAVRYFLLNVCVLLQVEDDGDYLNASGVWHLNACGAQMLHISMRPPPGASLSNVSACLQVLFINLRCAFLQIKTLRFGVCNFENLTRAFSLALSLSFLLSLSEPPQRFGARRVVSSQSFFIL